MKNSIFIFFILSLTLFSKGVITKVQGEALLIHKNRSSIIKKGDTILNSDTIKTKRYSRVALTLSDGTFLQIGGDSTFILEEDEFTPKKKSIFLHLKEGFLRFITGEIGKVAPERFKVKVSNATIGIRGTDVALFKENDNIGVLYLGKGKGVIVTALKNRTILKNIGDGVFLSYLQIPPLSSKWSEAQSRFLLKRLEFKNRRLKIKERFSINGDIYFFYSKTENKKNSDIIGNIGFSYPIYNGFFIQSRAYASKGILTILEAFIGYKNSSWLLSFGAISINTPFISSSPILPNFNISRFERWDKKDRYSWFWNIPTTFKGTSIIYRKREDLRLHFSYINKIKNPKSNKFEDIEKGFNFNSRGAINIGANYLPLKNWHIQGWLHHFNNGFDTIYLQSDYILDIKNRDILFSLQYLKEYKNSFNGTLFGGRLGYSYKGFQTALSYTQTGKEDILTPFDGTPAFTNPIILRNQQTVFPDKRFDVNGAYGKNTKAKQIMLGYNLNGANIKGLKITTHFTNYIKKDAIQKAKEYDISFNYKPPKREKINLNLSISKVVNGDFISQKESFIRFLIGYNF